jgi:pimeloyl-ACP methyl ester carboxylesterase
VCSQIDVPLDHSGQVGGSISLHVEVLPAAGVPKGVMFLIAGGPGQASARVFDLGSPPSAAGYRYLFPGYTLVAYDGRGTGGSGLLDCPSFRSAGPASSLGSACAAALGPHRDFYGPADQAEELETVRQALGFDRIALWGTSYGTKLALAYALAHPDHIERLLLDSVVPLELPDPFEANVLRMLPTALANFCAGAACGTATPDFAGEVVALANALAAWPLNGTVLQLNGRTRAAQLSGLQFLRIVLAADLNPGLAAELPAAVHAARLGHPQPLLRMAALLVGSNESADDFSLALYAAAVCRDGPFPWQAASPLADRPGLVNAAIDALPAGSLGPFGSWAAGLGAVGLCLGWPSPAGGSSLGAGPLPNVPMLALSGGFDMRTPTIDALSVTSRFPQGHLLTVPGVGHAVLVNSACAQEAVRGWILRQTVPGRCSRPKALIAPLTSYPATSPAHTSPAADARQTLATAASTIREAEATWLLTVGSGRSAATVAGIYGGKLATSRRTLTLVGYSIAPGVTLSGQLKLAKFTFPLAFTGSVTVTGAAASPGVLTAWGAHLYGTLGGRKVSD